LSTVSSVDDAVRAAGAARPGGIALVTEAGTAPAGLTWRDLDSRTSTLAERLEELVGRCAGPCVIEIGNGRSMPDLLLLVAALRAQAPVLLLDRDAPDDEQQAIRAELLRAGISLAAVEPGEAETEIAHRWLVSTTAGGTRLRLPGHALLLCSSGTTGRPKLVIETTLRRAAAVPARPRATAALNWQAGQTQLVIGQLHHAAPLTFFVHGLTDGNRLVVPTRFAPSIAMDLIEDQRVEWFQATPAQLQRMARWLCRHTGDLQTLRGVLHMSAPCPPQIKRFWIDRVGPEKVFEIYGASEGLGTTVASGQEWLARPGTVGRGFMTQIRVLDNKLRRLPSGDVGMVFLRNRAASSSPVYLNGDGPRTAPDGFRTVGDHGHVDDDGYLYLTPRRVDVINVGGENVYPAEVEDVLVRFPGVADAAVTGTVDDLLGSRPVALVTAWPDTNLKEREIKEFCTGRLSGFKRPVRVLVVDEIPRTGSGKVDRARIAALVSRMPTHPERR
jgi:bile acid-coenzyme A ligase